MHITTAVHQLRPSSHLVHQTDAETLTVVSGDRPGSYNLTIERTDHLVTAIQFDDLPILLLFLQFRGQTHGWHVESSPKPSRRRTPQENDHAEGPSS